MTVRLNGKTAWDGDEEAKSAAKFTISWHDTKGGQSPIAGINEHDGSATGAKVSNCSYVHLYDYNLFSHKLYEKVVSSSLSTGYSRSTTLPFYIYGESKSTTSESTAQSSAGSKIKGTYYIDVSRKTYTLYFNANGGSVSESSRSVQYKSQYGTLPTPTRTGYTFKGWYTASSGGSSVSSSTTMGTSNVTIYAQWTANIYTVTLNKNGGTGGTSSVSATYNSAMPSISSLPTRTGYDFAGYYTSTSGGTKYYNTNGTSAKSWGVAGNTTLYAQWTAKTYTLTIKYYSQSATHSTNLNISAPSCTVSSSSIAYNGSSTISHTYSTTSYTITFSRANSSYDYYMKYGSAPTTSSYNGINSFTYSWTPTSNSTLNVYIYERYAISFNGNGYTGGTVPSSVYKIHGTSVTIPSNTLTRTGYTANGWNTNSSGTGSSYTTSYGTNSSATLYAKWTANSYTVSFDSNGGSAVSSKAVAYDSAYGTLTSPTRSGCTFEGWYKEASFVNKVTSSTIVKTAGNHTLYAKWVDNGANDLKYDSNEKYFYFEDGEYPQSYVGDDLNKTLTDVSESSLTKQYDLTYNNGTSNVNIPVYTYTDGKKYARVESNGQVKWFKVEPIRWRVSDYGVSNTSYPSGWTSYGAYNTNFTAVTDRVIGIGAFTSQNTSEGWSSKDSDLYKNTLANSSNVGLNYCATNVQIDIYKFGGTAQQVKVQSEKISYTGMRVATLEDVKTNLTDYSAKASDMVKFILNASTDKVDYWTRKLGNNLNNGILINKAGTESSCYLDSINGVRFAITFVDGHRI